MSMLKPFKCFVFAFVAMVALGVFADANNILIGFSTPGPDKYADGATVVDGEWFALVWTKNAAFGGLTLAGEPKVEGDKVIYFAKLAKGGRCPYTVFQIDWKEAPTGGKYSVVMLDTRDASKTAVAAADAKGLPQVVNGETSAPEQAVCEVAGGTAAIAVSAGVDWQPSEVKGFKPPRFKSFRVVDAARVEFEVEDLMPGVKYNVVMGETPSKLTSYALEVPATVSGEKTDATFVIDSGDARFFSVVREPLVKEAAE